MQESYIRNKIEKCLQLKNFEIELLLYSNFEYSCSNSISSQSTIVVENRDTYKLKQKLISNNY